MERAILFRFHKKPQICKERIRYLKDLNPDIKIYGLGEDIFCENVQNFGLEKNYVISNKSQRWKWLNGDLAIRKWFNENKGMLEFDYLHLVDWDFVPMEPMEYLYPDISDKHIFLSGVIPLEKAQEFGWQWASGNNISLVKQLKDYAERQGFEINKSYAGIFPGASFSYAFLEEFSSLEYIPEIGNDELRVGVLAPAMGYDICDTGFYDGWSNEEICEEFNMSNVSVPAEVIQQRINGRSRKKAFHPVKENISHLLKERANQYQKNTRN